VKADNAYQLFLREGGGGKKAWINTNQTVRDAFTYRARKLQAKRKAGGAELASEEWFLRPSLHVHVGFSRKTEN
jgi:hypothetical protein